MSVSPADQRTAPTASPDWAAIGYDVLCPLCEYNLRGLIEPRCPECGYRFDWPEVLNPQRGWHPYLFEHHPERNWWSYRQTVRGACRSRRFWQSLHPSQPSRPSRMLIYWLIGAGALMMVSVLFLVPNAVYGIRVCNVRRAHQVDILKQGLMDSRGLIAYYGSLEAYLDRFYPTGLTYLKRSLTGGGAIRWYRSRFVPLVLAVLLVWPWLSLGAMMIFQASMRRGRLKPIHLARSVLYSFDPSAWAALLVVACLATTVAPFLFVPSVQTLSRGNPDYVIRQTFGWIGLAVAWSAWRLRMACKCYLRFTWPTATVLATQAITFMAALAMLEVYDSGLLHEVFQFLGLVPPGP